MVGQSLYHEQLSFKLSEMKPRIWTSVSYFTKCRGTRSWQRFFQSREELAVLLPELAGSKCLNGVSWLMYETPMVLIDESTTRQCFDISLQEDSVTLDLLMYVIEYFKFTFLISWTSRTREFSLPWPPTSEKIPVPAECSTVNVVPDNRSFANNAGPASRIESLQATETVESTKHASDEAKVKQIQDAKALQDTFIPSTVPEEIQAIIDSYLAGRPLLLIISNKKFFDYWSLRLPKEFGFFMLGYFRILGVQVLIDFKSSIFVLIQTFFKESRVHPNDSEPPLKDSSELMTGRLKWCFRLRWSPGGEEWILPNHDKDLLEHPWWKPPSPPSIPPLEQIKSLDKQSMQLASRWAKILAQRWPSGGNLTTIMACKWLSLVLLLC